MTWRIAVALAVLAAASPALAQRPALAGEQTFGVAGGDILVHYATTGADAVTMTDRDTNGPRGFAFVEMANDAEAGSAMQSLNGFRLNDREMQLNEARAKDDHDTDRDSSREHRRHKI